MTGLTHDTDTKIALTSQQRDVLEEWWKGAMARPERTPTWSWIRDERAVVYQCYPKEMWHGLEPRCGDTRWVTNLTMKVVRMWYPEGLRRVLEGLD